MKTKRNIKIEGPALEIAKQVQRLHGEIELKKRDMQARFDREWDEFIKVQQVKLEDAFRSLEQSVGLPIQDEYELDVTYLQDCGEAYLKPRQPEKNGLEQYLSTMGQPSPSKEKN